MSDKDKNIDSNFQEMGLPIPFEVEEKSTGNFELQKKDTNQETPLISSEKPQNINETPEISTEKSKEIKIEQTQQNTITRHKQPPVGIINDVQDEFEEKIEEIMSGDLVEEYKKMTFKEQKKFKEVGEETANRIKKLLIKSKVNIKKIINLLVKWLKLIPGVNKYFLEQEAKIKADKLIDIKDELSNK